MSESLKKVKHLVQATGNFHKTDAGEDTELEIVSGKFKGCRFYFSEMKFADEENEDGTIDMTFQKDITNDFKVSEDDEKEFNTFLGDTIIRILQEMIEKNEAVYKGGI